MTTHPSAWYPVARSDELRAGSNIVGGFANGVELALWRSASGEAQAWENRCPHRSVRFTLGQVVGDRLSCAYHGWQYAAGSGQCTGIPAHPKMAPPRNVCAKTFPVVEASGMVWASLDPQGAAPAPADALPSGWSFCRSLVIRKPFGAVSDAFEAAGWREAAQAWMGELGGVAARAILLDAQAHLAIAHLWTEAMPGSSQMARLHIAARRMRREIESSSH